ncbi:MAG: cytochrome c3 family protein [Armatimonadota bacterium]
MMRSTILRSWPMVLVAGGVVLLLSRPGVAPQIEGAKYLGSKACKLCHEKTVQTKVYEPWSKTKHAQVKPAEGAPPEEVYRHVTGYDAATGEYKEEGVACEACHGPNSLHIAAATKEDKQTLNPAKMEPAQAVSICGRCHSQGTTADGDKYPKGFRQGQDLMKSWTLAAEVTGDTKLRQLNDLQQSKHLEKGVTCITCHTAHQEVKAAPQLREELNALCLNCHDDQTAKKCTEDFPAEQKCSECHMPDKRHVFVTK